MPRTCPRTEHRILGMGCARCSQLENDVRDLLSEMKIAANLRHVTDFKEIAHYKLLGSPALVINNKVVCVAKFLRKVKSANGLLKLTLPINNF